ncbi:hypothetical protein VE00_09797 [Pseudogymnoascus sp. WSF 3629]|nr:hypothetical protein VE00_09797 [Pseudogymnoascus sp. WSF 3629]
MAPVNVEEEEELSIIHQSFDREMGECRKHVVEEVVGEAALFRVDGTEYGKKGENPFYMDMKDGTHARGIRGSRGEEEMGREEREQMEELDRACLQFCIELLDHRLVGNPYDSAIISGLSILGIGPGETWVKATEYMTIYSAIIKVARALVVEEGY